MKVVRIVQLFLVLALIVYLLLLHNMNPQSIRLPFLIPLPTSFVVTGVIILSVLVGWGTALGRVWQLSRENRRLERRLTELGAEPETPVIPDRAALSSGKNDPKRAADPEHA